MTKADILFQKALLKLDRGRTDEAEADLRNAIQMADEEKDELTLIGASCCLGKVLFNSKLIEEAKIFLQKVVDVNRDDDVLSSEIRIARQLLDQMQE